MAWIYDVEAAFLAGAQGTPMSAGGGGDPRVRRFGHCWIRQPLVGRDWAEKKNNESIGAGMEPLTHGIIGKMGKQMLNQELIGAWAIKNYMMNLLYREFNILIWWNLIIVLC
jgi:hypothetical protein